MLTYKRYVGALLSQKLLHQIVVAHTVAGEVCLVAKYPVGTKAVQCGVSPDVKEVQARCIQVVIDYWMYVAAYMGVINSAPIAFHPVWGFFRARIRRIAENLQVMD